MLTLSAKTRKDLGKKTKALRQKGILPAVLYGPKIKSAPLEINLQEFEKIYQEAGESSLVSLTADGKNFLVLIHDVSTDPLTGRAVHVDFYQPSLEKEVEVNVPLVFEGEAPAIKELGGTLVKNISEVEVKALPQKLPKEIRVDVGNLKTFEDHILIKDLLLPEGAKILKEPNEIVAQVTPLEKVEEELEKPIEEKVEEVKIVEKPEKEIEKEEAPEETEK
jgi:large subunit ribosomal protein L25